MPSKDPCLKYACKIQVCLEKNKYQESKCQFEINNILKCCQRYEHLNLVCCSGFRKRLAEASKKLADAK